MQTKHIQFNADGEWTAEHHYFTDEYAISVAISPMNSQNLPITALRILESDPPMDITDHLH